MKWGIAWTIIVGMLLGPIAFAEEASPTPTAQPSVTYVLTDLALAKLKDAGAPEAVLRQLTRLKDQVYASEEDVITALQQALDADTLPTYQAQIVAAARQEPPFTYDPKNRREPFQPLTPTDVTPLPGTPAPGASALEQMDVTQLRVIGILRTETTAFAKVIAPDGNTYTLAVGTPVGMYNGRVLEITADAVRVQEHKTYHTGDRTETKAEDVLLKLSPLEGEQP